MKELVKKYIENKTFPSCCIATNINSIGIECGGRYTYDIASPSVSMETYYDISSLTKIMVTIPALMILYDQGLLDLDQKISDFFPSFSQHNKNNITILNLILWDSGLTKIYGFDKNTTKGQMLQIICDVIPEFSIGEKIYYNDISYILLGEIIQKISWMGLWDFISENFFKKLNINAVFGPLDPLQCAPTREVDSRFNPKPCQWFVDDKKAYVMWNQSGFAWIFANIQDIQNFCMFMISDGQNVITPQTLNLFTSQYKNYDRSYGRNINTEKTELRTLLSFTHHSISQHKWLPADPRYITIPWPHRSVKTLFHGWFTWASILIDRYNKKYVAFVSNRTYEMQNANNINVFRKELYSAIN